MDIDQIIQKFKKSVLFELSLSNKELFHSNLLGWVFENYKDQTINFLINKLPENYHNNLKNSFKKVIREDKNIDIKLVFDDFEVIIENKIKALPTPNQLDGYITTNTNDIYILFALVKPQFFDSKNIYEGQKDSIKGNWQFISYDDIILLLKTIKKGLRKELKSIIDKKSTGNREIKIKSYAFIHDYIEYLNALQNLTIHLPVKKDDQFDFYHGDILQKLTEIRLHDFYLKYKYQEIGILLKNKIDEFLKTSKNKIKYTNYFINSPVVTMDASKSGVLTHSIPIEINSYRYNIGIQIEKNYFKMFCSCEMLEDRKYKLKTKNGIRLNKCFYNYLSANNFWPIKINKLKLKGEGRKQNGQKKGYNSYFGDSWIYKYVELEEYKISEVLEIYMNCYKTLLKNIETIKAELNKYK